MLTFKHFVQFEYQQAQLEAEIENLSWKIEHAETTDRGDLENQMDVAEKRRYKYFSGSRISNQLWTISGQVYSETFYIREFSFRKKCDIIVPISWRL